MLGKLDIHMQKSEVSPLSHTIYKNQVKWINDLNIKSKTIKPLEENTGVSLHDLGFGNEFLDMTPKAQATKEKK